MDRDDLIAVAEDLEYLSLWGSDISNAEIRRGTAILRRLLVEDVYGAAWRAVGESNQPSVTAVDLLQFLDNDTSEVVYALAAGALFRGLHMAGLVLKKGTTPIRNAPSQPSTDGYPSERAFSLSEYLSSLSGIAEGRTFNRREVIKYLANVKGGVHLGAKQRKAEEKLIARLGKIEKRMLIFSSDGLLVEAVAIGQAVGKSADAKMFINKVRSLPMM